MREIKFRGKRVDNGEWVYGLPVNYCNETYILVLTDFEEERVYEQYPHKEMWPYEIIPETVGQYTGFKDKNSKEIFEGDIVELRHASHYSYRGKIVFNKKTCGLEIWYNLTVGAYGEKATHKINFAQYREIEVIGNIHDNPELLEVV